MSEPVEIRSVIGELGPHPSQYMTPARYAEWCAVVEQESAIRARTARVVPLHPGIVLSRLAALESEVGLLRQRICTLERLS